MCAKRKQQILAVITCFLLVVAVVLGAVISNIEKRYITIGDNQTPLAGAGTLVEQTDADIYVIPDKYNTGCKGELTKITEATTINDILFKYSGGYVILDFFYSNKDKEGNFVFENLDFSDAGFSFNSEGKVSGKKINVTFNNCKFANVKNAYPKSDVFSYTFNNCSIRQFLGSNATFNRCQFGHSYNDCLVPFQSIHVNDCYFLDLASTDTAGYGKHSDGSQIYANKDVMAKDISFSRCRFEVPAVQTTGNTAAVNACLSVALEYNDADNIHISDCIANGGGYTFYASKKYDSITLSNICFDNIKVGCAKLFGTFYPKVADGVTLNGVVDQDALYVSSVWKENGKTHLIVTNDTGIERTLKVVTKTKEYTYSIKACLGGKDLRFDNFDMPFSDFPFDMDIVIPEDAQYVICYDATNNKESQIRFVNWSGEQIYVGGVIQEEPKDDKKNNKNKKKISKFDADKPVIVEVEEPVKTQDEETVETGLALSGSCGKNVAFSLSEDGTLTITGQGEMTNFDSSKPSPWADRIGDIRKAIIENGVTTIGGQSFRKAVNLVEVSIPDSVVDIKGNAFQNCGKLTSITISKNVTAIGRYAFAGTGLVTASFQGTEDDWANVSVGDNNEPLLNSVSFIVSNEPQTEEPETSGFILEGTCGQGVYFTLSNDGELIFSGTGEMKTFDSSKPAPWYDYMGNITKVVIKEGVTSVGGQSFRKAINLSEVIIPSSVIEIKGNAFQGCSSLKEITISKNVIAIGRYAFSTTGLVSATFEGSEEEFAMISLGDHNESLIDCLTFME